MPPLLVSWLTMAVVMTVALVYALRGLTKPLWTYNEFLARRPIRDIYGVVETPDTAGLIDVSHAAVGRSALNER